MEEDDFTGGLVIPQKQRSKEDATSARGSLVVLAALLLGVGRRYESNDAPVEARTRTRTQREGPRTRMEVGSGCNFNHDS